MQRNYVKLAQVKFRNEFWIKVFDRSPNTDYNTQGSVFGLLCMWMDCLGKCLFFEVRWRVVIIGNE